MLSEAGASAATGKDTEEIGNAEKQLENMSKKVHERYNFTYAPLAEIKLLI